VIIHPGCQNLFCATGCENLKFYRALLIGITIINSCKQSAEFACLKGNVTYNIPAYILFQIGFNAGNGTQSYEYFPYSQNSVLRDLVGRGWTNDFPGRHIFRIDEKIMIGNCNKDLGMCDFHIYNEIFYIHFFVPFLSFINHSSIYYTYLVLVYA
jgi:hypothetical protein